MMYLYDLTFYLVVNHFLWDVIIHRCHNFNDLIKPLLKLEHGWVITSHYLRRVSYLLNNKQHILKWPQGTREMARLLIIPEFF